MPNYDDPKRSFHNRRDWNSFLSKLQTAASYPLVMEAVKSGRAWFNLDATKAPDWFGGSPELADKLSP